MGAVVDTHEPPSDVYMIGVDCGGGRERSRLAAD